MLFKLNSRLANLTPAQTLFFLSPLLGELVSSYLSPLEFFNPLLFVITVVPYGCGALIVRELVVRSRKGWISLVLLGLAFGLFFEGIVTRVLFNPDWEDLGALGEYSHVYAFTWTMAVGVVHFHAVISIICAILLAEMIYPAQRHESWISTRKLITCCVALPGWTLVIGTFAPFIPPLPGAFVLIGLVAVLIGVALIIPAEPFAPRQRPTPRPVIFGLVGGVGMTAIMIGTYMIPEFDFRPPLLIMFVSLLVMVAAEFVLLTWLNNGGAAWSDRHRLALVSGFLVFFLVFGIGQDLEAFTGRSLVSIVTIWQLRRLWQHLGARERGDLPVRPVTAEM
ncbi:MAG: hypothetical protein JW966_12675 [Anaerolineae bacterium]|nr:hypothetical protein [Anaerolineae bacterium]